MEEEENRMKDKETKIPWKNFHTQKLRIIITPTLTSSKTQLQRLFITLWTGKQTGITTWAEHQSQHCEAAGCKEPT